MTRHLFSSQPENKILSPSSFDLPGFDLIGQIGRGTFTSLWKLRGRESHREYVLKQLRTEWATDYSARQFLENEAQVASQLDSPFLPTLVHAAPKDPLPYLIMEWCPGCSLTQFLEEKKVLDAGETVWIVRQIVDALGDLETAGFSHGDLKPENILVDETKQVRLIDLAFARKINGDDVANIHATLMGTPEYLAPEALTRSKTSPVLQDVYAVGILFYRMLTGRLPFVGQAEQGFEEVWQQQRESLPPALRRFCPQASVEMIDLIGRLLAKQPLRRPQSMRKLSRELIDVELTTMSSRFRAA